MRTREPVNAYLLIAFPLTVLFLFTLLPTLLGLGLSLFAWDGSEARFVGLGNFRALAADARFGPALRNTLMFVVLSVPPTVLIAFGLAVLVNARWMVGRAVVRTLIFMPTVVSIVAIGFMWRWMLDDEGGQRTGEQGRHRRTGPGGWGVGLFEEHGLAREAVENRARGPPRVRTQRVRTQGIDDVQQHVPSRRGGLVGLVELIGIAGVVQAAQARERHPERRAFREADHPAQDSDASADPGRVEVAPESTSRGMIGCRSLATSGLARRGVQRVPGRSSRTS